MSTLEALIQAGQALPYAERQKLIEALRQETEPEPMEAPREAVRRARGRMKGLLPSVDEFLTEKHSSRRG